MDKVKDINNVNDKKAEGKLELAEVWLDYVDFKELLYSLAICTVGALGGYIIAPNTPPKPLTYGLTGVLIGFFLCAFLFKPKRKFVDEEEVDE